MSRHMGEKSGSINIETSPQATLSGGRRNPDERGIHSYIAMTLPQDEKKVVPGSTSREPQSHVGECTFRFGLCNVWDHFG